MPLLDFKGKSVIYTYHLGVPFRALMVDEKKSLPSKDSKGKKQKPSLDDNLIINGDNLHALKALLPRYAGKIKCIYIDPPYNTGNEGWRYNDNVNNPMLKEWLKTEVGTDDMERHDKWLCMMWPRLQLLKELLSEDGVIFVSIDDNEQSSLKIILDEIFGRENFLTQIIVKSNRGGRDYGGVALTHEYVLVYSRESEENLNLVLSENKEFSFKDDLGSFSLRELRNRNVKFNKGNRPNLYYPFYVERNNPDEDSLYNVSLTSKKGFIEVLPLKSQSIQTVWRWGKEKSSQNLNTNIKAKRKRDGTFMIVEKYRCLFKRERSIFDDTDVRNEAGTLSLKSIFQNRNLPFEYPKSPYLIKKLINLGATKNSIILDSFAGSGTTAHAVLALNKEDGGNRKFILVECEKYADKITAERVRKVIKGVPKAKDEQLKDGLAGSFTYCTLGKEISEENLLKGKSLPSYEILAKYVFYTAIGKALGRFTPSNDFYVAKTGGDTAFFVIYQPKLKFLRSNESALSLQRKEAVLKSMKRKKCSKAIVFAAACFCPLKELSAVGISFSQLPFAIYRIAR